MGDFLPCHMRLAVIFVLVVDGIIHQWLHSDQAVDKGLDIQHSAALSLHPICSLCRVEAARGACFYSKRCIKTQKSGYTYIFYSIWRGQNCARSHQKKHFQKQTRENCTGTRHYRKGWDFSCHVTLQDLRKKKNYTCPCVWVAYIW